MFMNNKNAAYINQCIESMLPRLCNGSFCQGNFYFEPLGNDIEVVEDDVDDTGFSRDFATIKESFGCQSSGCCNNNITKNDILMQLVLIDSLYSTNIKRMRAFALEEICDDIWNLCDAGNGCHTFGTLTSKINATQNLHSSLLPLFTNSYGYIKGAPAGTAPSLISKYLFFATVACPIDQWGFPIYDSIAKDMLRRIQKFLGIPVTPLTSSKFSIDLYIAGLKSVIDALESNNPQLWSNLPVLKFQLLDYFLWHIGKVGSESYSLLLTKNEVQNCYSNGKIVRLPKRIAYWQSVYNKI